MTNPVTQLQRNEQMIFDLRAMYADYGYAPFRIRKFEEYELYVKNKDFIDSANIITFTDTNGKLMALKPDVTLSVVKNSRDVPGQVQKVYYNENIYRVSRRSHMFEELMQVGIECIGDIDDYNIHEVLMLAAMTLQYVSPEGVLVVSDLDILSRIMDHYWVPADVQEELIACLGEKNIHTLRRICRESEIDEICADLLARMARIYGRPEKVLAELEELIREAEAKEEAPEDGEEASPEGGEEAPLSLQVKEVTDHLRQLLDAFVDEEVRDMIRIDFSVVSDVNYYNGIVFNGFVEGLPDCVISGGQYDRLMQKMKRKSGAIGFGVYMDRLERYLATGSDYDIDILLLYDEKEDMITVKRRVEELVVKGNRVLAQRAVPKKLVYRKLMQVKDGEVTEIGSDD
ncbi:MAG: ATP phosphoribosyltransferase regulatory subunit [Firmicutes bacterium]|nr:ATP phosphoribosyltransferase regulatory subunit [Bacillota bacterium]